MSYYLMIGACFFKLKGPLQGLGKLSLMTHLATSTVTWFPTRGHMHFMRTSQYTRNQSSRRDLIWSDAVGKIHGARLVRTKQRSLQQANTIHMGLWRRHMFSFTLVCLQLISLELCLDTSGLASMDIYVFAQHQPFSSYIRLCTKQDKQYNECLYTALRHHLYRVTTEVYLS